MFYKDFVFVLICFPVRIIEVLLGSFRGVRIKIVPHVIVWDLLMNIEIIGGLSFESLS